MTALDLPANDETPAESATVATTPSSPAAPAAAPGHEQALIVRRLGRAEYIATWRAMQRFTAGRAAHTPDELWVVEHPPVFTLGQAGRSEHLLDTQDTPVVHSDRGGQVTYHGPGQVLVYMLLDLRRLGIYVKEMVYRIETAVMQTLASYDVDGRRIRGAPGIYVPYDGARSHGEFGGCAKIAALGIKISHGCSTHGVALNVAMDLRPFQRINPCGYASLTTIDLATLGVHAQWEVVADRLVERLAAHFSVPVPPPGSAPAFALSKQQTAARAI